MGAAATKARRSTPGPSSAVGKVIAKKYRTLTPDECDRLLAAMPGR